MAATAAVYYCASASCNYEHVAREMASILSDLDLQAVAYDRCRIDLLRKELNRIGADVPLIEWGQGYKDMAPALDALEAERLNARALPTVTTPC